MINIYEEDYYRMALRRILKHLYGKVDFKIERKFMAEVHSLKDHYTENEIHDYVFYNKII